MPYRRFSYLFWMFLLLGQSAFLPVAGTSRADIVVLANRTGQTVQIQIDLGLLQRSHAELPSGAVLPVACEGPIEVVFQQDRIWQQYALDANAAYYFGQDPRGRIVLRKIGLGGDDQSRRGRPLPSKAEMPGAIGITIAVDEEETERRSIWEKRLRQRIRAASEILQRQFRIQLQIVRITTWDSDNATTDLQQSLREFEREVDPSPGRLAIGFTSQYRVPSGRIHIGGTRGPLESHILIREWSRHINEPEQLELLVHELGHYFGAAHSPESESVMRPLFGDRNARRKGYAIRFDPVNSLIVGLVTEEIRRRGIRQFTELTPDTKRRLIQIYDALDATMPDDQVCRIHRQLLNVKRPNKH